MASYVERDGDWVLRPPGRLRQVGMHIFVFRSHGQALLDLCRRFIDTPTNNAVTATPLFPNHPFVLLVCADIQRGFSDDVDDVRRGGMRERDVGFFVPVTMRKGGTVLVANLLPYLYVDNFPAVLIGREVFGFPKVLADVHFRTGPWRVSVESEALPVGSPTGEVQRGSLLEITDTGVLPIPGVPVLGPVLTIVQALAAAVAGALGESVLGIGGFDRIPMAFLKQFRDARSRAAACHQSIVRAEGAIDAIRSAAILGAHYELSLPTWANLDIAGTLGLGGGNRFQPLIALSLNFDFSLDFGQQLWP